MRILVDVHGAAWEEAWRITSGAFCYTNHTLLPEALESWPVPLMERLLPRHMQIIYLINAPASRCCATSTAGRAAAGGGFTDREQGGRRVRMGHLAFLGSHKVNGVSALHTELDAQDGVPRPAQLYPDRIVNKTNGITFRRWLLQANPGLTKLLSRVGRRRRCWMIRGAREIAAARRRYGIARPAGRDTPCQQGGAGRLICRTVGDQG